MSPWLLLIFFLSTGDFVAMQVPSEHVCRQQEAIVQSQAPVPVQTGCYRLAGGI